MWRKKQKESDTVTLDGRVGGGVQLIPFLNWLISCAKEYGGDGLGVVRRLHLPFRKFENDWTTNFPELLSFMKKMNGASYETSRRQLVRSVIKLNRSEDLASVFCSELVAATYKCMNLVEPTMNANNFTPVDFSSPSTSSRKTKIQLLRGVTLEKEVRLLCL